MTNEQNSNKNVTSQGDNGDTESAVQKRIAEQKRKFLIAFNEHKGIVKYACEAIGISRQAFYEWRAADPEFAQACVDAAEGAIDHVERKLHKLINKGDTTAILFYLRCKGKKRGFVERQEITPVDPDGQALAIPVINVSVVYPEGYDAAPGSFQDVQIKSPE